jgi:hypothetical protein
MNWQCTAALRGSRRVQHAALTHAVPCRPTWHPHTRRCAPCARHADEADEFVKLLDSRELAASADEGVLVHLLLRADSINRRHLDWRRLKVHSRRAPGGGGRAPPPGARC